jgi:CHAT domain-containing protein/Tfp pilus assembly protein PilF
MPRNRQVYFFVLCIAIGIILQMEGSAYASSRPLANDALAPGVRVQEVSKNTAAERAGLQKGDIILGWSRGQENGKIETPFDFDWVDIEQRPRGELVLTGTRASVKKTWALSNQSWGIKTSPVYQGRLLQVFQHSQALLKAGEKTAAAKYWTTTSAPLPATSWLPAWSAYYSAKLYQYANDISSADSAYQQAARLSANLDKPVQARIAKWWGDLYCDCSGARQFKGTDHYREALNLLQPKDKGTLLEAYYLAALGISLMDADEIDEAQDDVARSLEIRKRLAPDSIEVAESLAYMGYTAAFAEEFQNATELLEQALEMQQRLDPGSMQEASMASALSWIEGVRGRLVSAEKHGMRSLEIDQKLIPVSLQTADVLVAVAFIENQRGDHSGAAKLVRQAITALKQIHTDDLYFAIDYAQLAIFEYDLGVFRQAEKDFILAERFFLRVQNDANLNYLGALNNLGEYARKAGKFQQAQRYLNTALKLEEKMKRHAYTKYETLVQLGSVYLAIGDPVRSGQIFQEALPILARVSPGSYDLATVFSNLARIALLKHDQENAEKFYEQAVSTIEEQTAQLGGSRQIRSEYRGNQASYYRDYMDLLIQRGKITQAFDTSERFRAQTLLETLTRATVDVHQGRDPELRERKRKLDAQIAVNSDRRMHLLTQEHQVSDIKAIEESTADLLSERAGVEALLNASSQNDAQAQFHTLSAKEVQEQLLDKDTVLLEYELGTQKSYVFVVTANSLTAHELPRRSKIESAARRMYKLLKAQRLSPGGRDVKAQHEYQEAAAFLSKMVLEPVTRDISNKRLVIVADGALQYVPFAALPDPGSSKRQSQPLIFDHEIVNLPSASVLAVLRKQEKNRVPSPKAVAVLADPVFGSDDPRVSSGKTRITSAHALNPVRDDVRGVASDATKNQILAAPTPLELLTRSASDVGLERHAALSFPRLIYTRKEADEILAVTPEGLGKKAVDFDASRAMATSPELSQYRIVHFATHGLLDSAHPELSGLVFSMVDKKGRPQNGFLELQDIYNLNLPADLVVLSACETGLGKEISGEGLVGLTRGFMYAGASRVVASLWRVSDVGTAELMAAFYTSMEKDGLPPAAALRAAQIKLWKQKRWNNPYYWAAFQIQGEWK